MNIVLLDGPMGTELDARGVDTTLPLWSARALDTAPDVVATIHRDYAASGARVHTANTFRTKRRTLPTRWAKAAESAVSLARSAVPTGCRVAGSISPLEDCYRPDLSPRADSRNEHRELARVLAGAGCDVLLCETFPNVEEALVATEEAVETGVETWLALTAGPNANLLSPVELASAAERAAIVGARVVMVNCVPLDATQAYVRELARVGVPFGAYANAGSVDDRVGWRADAGLGPARYADAAMRWVERGATVVGSCCGTGPAHIEALRQRLYSATSML